MQDTMQALVWLGPHQMEIENLPTPTLAENEVLIEVAAVGICGSELGGYLGHNSLRKPPLVMGHEAAGKIVQTTSAMLGDGSPATVNTRVTFNPLIVCGVCDLCRSGHANICRNRKLIGAHRPGAFARFVAVPASQCLRLPDHLSEVAGSLTEPLACSVRAVSLSGAHPSSRLLIIGAGPIGLFCLVAARSAGIEQVYISDLSPSRLEIARQWGASQTILASERDVVATIQELAPGGADVVIDAVGANITRKQAVQAVVPGGRVVFIGLHDEESPLAANYLVRQEVTITGCFGYSQADFQKAFDLLVQGRLQVDTSWLEERPLTDGRNAFEALVNGKVAATKIVLHLA